MSYNSMVYDNLSLLKTLEKPFLVITMILIIFGFLIFLIERNQDLTSFSGDEK